VISAYLDEVQGQNVYPQRGDPVRWGGGIRKFCYALQGRGKRGGVQAVYRRVKDKPRLSPISQGR
jgi:hypothetical protein